MYVIRKKQKSISLLTSPTLFPKESNHEKQLEVYISRPCFRPLQTCMSVSGYVICLVVIRFRLHKWYHNICSVVRQLSPFRFTKSWQDTSTHCQITPSCLALAWHSILYPSLLTAPLLVGIQVAFNSPFFFSVINNTALNIFEAASLRTCFSAIERVGQMVCLASFYQMLQVAEVNLLQRTCPHLRESQTSGRPGFYPLPHRHRPRNLWGYLSLLEWVEPL